MHVRCSMLNPLVSLSFSDACVLRVEHRATHMHQKSLQMPQGLAQSDTHASEKLKDTTGFNIERHTCIRKA
jgi:hypothetical protein